MFRDDLLFSNLLKFTKKIVPNAYWHSLPDGFVCIKLGFCDGGFLFYVRRFYDSVRSSF